MALSVQQLGFADVLIFEAAIDRHVFDAREDAVRSAAETAQSVAWAFGLDV